MPFRNLGGGDEFVNDGADHLSIKNSLKLTELTPTPYPFTRAKGPSGVLIPETAINAGGQNGAVDNDLRGGISGGRGGGATRVFASR